LLPGQDRLHYDSPLFFTGEEMAKTGLCGWGSCESYDTPLVLTVPSAFDEKGERKRFCCLQHLAAWSIKCAAKEAGGNVDTAVDELRITENVQVLIGMF
jgi:hypothetical protein